MRIDDNSIRVDRTTCIACGICVDRCTMDNLRLSVAPCRQACPLDMNCQGAMRLLALGKEEQALELVRAYGPLLGVIARDCKAPCESACTRRKEDGAVHILKLHQYLARTCADRLRAIDVPDKPSGRRIAVVGADVAAMACALRAVQGGHAVAVFADGRAECGDVAAALEAAGAVFRAEADLDPAACDAVVLSRPGRGPLPGIDVAADAVDAVSHQVEGKVFRVDSGRVDKGVAYAIAEAFEAMCSVERFLDGVPFAWGRDLYAQGGRVKEYRVDRRVGSDAPRSPDAGPDSVFDAATAREQASRCFGCGRAFERNRTCWYCLPCELECPQRALEVRMPYLVR